MGTGAVRRGSLIPSSIIHPFFQESLFASAHLANTASLADLLRCLAVSFLARAGPPFRPPKRPKATAAGFLRFLAIKGLYVTALEYARGKKISLDIRDRSRMELGHHELPNDRKTDPFYHRSL
jgi:hypothetical protein